MVERRSDGPVVAGGAAVSGDWALFARGMNAAGEAVAGDSDAAESASRIGMLDGALATVGWFVSTVRDRISERGCACGCGDTAAGSVDGNATVTMAAGDSGAPDACRGRLGDCS